MQSGDIMTGPPPQPHPFSPRTQLHQMPRPLCLHHLSLAGDKPCPTEAASHWLRSLLFACLWGWGRGVIAWNPRTSFLFVWVIRLPIAGPRLALWPQPSLTLSLSAAVSLVPAGLSLLPGSRLLLRLPGWPPWAGNGSSLTPTL